MLKRTVLVLLLVAWFLPGVQAQVSTPPKVPPQRVVRAPQKDDAEAVFAKTASKVVYLIARKSGEPHAIASGVILGADGYIATNYHALQGADAVEIRFFPDAANSDDYQSFNAPKLLYADPDRDVAVLKVGSSSLPFLECGTGTARVGMKVYAIGNPEGLSNTISEGIVSALRTADNEDLIQHTAAISPGSSGGALVDSAGDLLGMNSWQMREGQNLNFAISGRHLLEALTSARTRATALSLPPDEVPAQRDAPEETARQANQVAVAALRKIADTIKECPRVIWFESPDTKGPMSRSRVYFGPPTNVVWDVTRNTSVRSPYTGYIEFTVPRTTWVPTEVWDKWTSKASDATKDFFLRPVPSLKTRYEYDVGPAGLQLTRMLSRSADESEWKDGPSQKACSQSGCATLCWEDAAQKWQIVQP
jgi:hypothetical protein